MQTSRRHPDSTACPWTYRQHARFWNQRPTSGRGAWTNISCEWPRLGHSQPESRAMMALLRRTGRPAMVLPSSDWPSPESSTARLQHDAQRRWRRTRDPRSLHGRSTC